MASLPKLPDSLKSIQHYLKTAVEHDKRDPVVAYYCRMYALQRGMELDRSSPEAKTFLFSLMDILEKVKQENDGNEAITSELVGSALVEGYALKVFLFADNEDRAGRFNKNVVKSFYTAGMLFDVLTNFGELSEDIHNNRKYAKWKAAYIHKCLKNGETPVSGPLNTDDDEEGAVGGMTDAVRGIGFEGTTQPPDPRTNIPPPDNTASQYLPQPPSGYTAVPPTAGGNDALSAPPMGTHAPANTPAQTPTSSNNWTPQVPPGSVQLDSTDYQRAMKLCKFASSALQYEDSPTAIDNLRKALSLLTTGKES